MLIQDLKTYADDNYIVATNKSLYGAVNLIKQNTKTVSKMNGRFGP